MSLNPNQWTSKVQEAWQAASTLCSDEGHAEVAPVHLAVVLFEDPEGLGRQVRLLRLYEPCLLGVFVTRQLAECAALSTGGGT